MLKRIPVECLKLGMYISELDRPWTETNFLFQGLLLESHSDIEQVKMQCDYVYIDSDEPDPAKSLREFGFNTNNRKEGIREILSEIPHGYKYPVTLAVEKEQARANKAYVNAVAVFRSVWSRVREQKPFQFEEIKHAITPVVDSIVRNPDAFLLLRTISTDEDYNTSHAINSCALAVAFGRHLGLSPNELTRLAFGAFLLDIGKARLPDTLLYKRGPLDLDELALLRSHSSIGVEILKASHCPDSVVIDMVGSHHERDNGDGYPSSLDGNQIPVYARIAGLVDCFDAITIERPYKKPLAHHAALQVIGDAKDVDFQEALTKAFIRCMGVYPTGSIVELNNGFEAIVIEQNTKNPQEPRCMLLRTKGSLLLDKRIIIDLGNQSNSSTPNAIKIAGMCAGDQINYRRINRELCKSAQSRQLSKSAFR